MSIPHSGSFLPRNNLFFLGQFILNELSSSHFPTFEIFIKILFLESLMIYHLENRKNIHIVSEFDEISVGH